MTAERYRAALATLGLTQAEAAAWLGVCKRTGASYASKGPIGPAARSITMLLDMNPADRKAALTKGLEL